MSRSFILFMISAFAIVGALFFFTLYKGSELPAPVASVPGGNPGGPPAPPVPSVVITMATSTKGDTITVTWANLPEGTIALDVFRSKKKVIAWELWQEITITSSTLAGGSQTFTLGKKEKAADYSFYVQAVSDTNEHEAGGGTNAKGEGILWTSAIFDAVPSNPGVSGGGVESEPGSGTSGGNGTGNGSGNGGGGTTSTASSTNGSGNGNGGGNGSGNQGGGTSGGGNGPAPSGTPYYTPEIQISGYGQPPGGSFWVQHIDQKIQIGWQNLPPPTTRIEVLRSTAETGPWSTVLIQQNPIIQGPYSIQVVDDTVGQPYYYELNDYSGSSTIGTYGPIYLPPVGE